MVEYVLVVGLLLGVVLGVIQVALVLQVRDVLVADAAEGARAAANAGSSLAAGEQVCTAAVGASLPAALTGPVRCTATLVSGAGGEALVAMRVVVQLPLTVFPLGALRLQGVAHVVAEP